MELSHFRLFVCYSYCQLLQLLYRGKSLFWFFTKDLVPGAKIHALKILCYREHFEGNSNREKFL